MEDDDPFIMFRFITLILTTSSVLLFFFIMHDAFFVKSQKSGGKDLFVVDRVSNVRDYYWMMMTRFLFFFFTGSVWFADVPRASICFAGYENLCIFNDVKRKNIYNQGVE